MEEMVSLAGFLRVRSLWLEDSSNRSIDRLVVVHSNEGNTIPS
jgi:hypothetical protein